MNLTHAHILLNHFPTIGMVVGLGVFLVALYMKSDDVKRVGLGIFFAIAMLSIPAFATGTAAYLDLNEIAKVPVSLIDRHKGAAFIALGVMELTGALAWLGLWQYRRLSRLPRSTVTAVLITALLTFGLMARAANIGGEIRHPEASETPAAATAAPEGATPFDVVVTNAIGSAMVDYQWCWAAGETIHFIGLSLLCGIVVLVDLRMLGFLKGIPYSMLHRLLPWGVLGFALNTTTGMFFFVGAPPAFYVTNWIFFAKLAAILGAGANALYFTVFDSAWAVGADDTPRMGVKFAAASGILLWIGVIFGGQMLPFIGRAF